MNSGDLLLPKYMNGTTIMTKEIKIKEIHARGLTIYQLWIYGVFIDEFVNREDVFDAIRGRK